MSDRTEKLSRSSQPTVTPNPDRPQLFDFIEDKFNGQAAFPKFLSLKLGVGKNGSQWRDETIWEKEFKENIAKPERAEMVTLANRFLALAQDHCNSTGKPQGYVVLAFNHTKSAYAYGIHFMALRVTQVSSQGLEQHGLQGGDDDLVGDARHRDLLLTDTREYMRENNEHVRFMYDNMLKSTGALFALQQEIIREQRAANHLLESQRAEWWKAVQESLSTQQDREMKAATHKVKVEMLTRGGEFLMQMIPVVAKTLERNKQEGLPANGHGQGPITGSVESIAIQQFAKALTEQQRGALLGTFDPQGVYSRGILTEIQVKILADVSELKMGPEALDLMMPGAEHAVTPEQIAQAQVGEHAIPLDKFMPLYAIILERQRQQMPSAESSLNQAQAQ